MSEAEKVFWIDPDSRDDMPGWTVKGFRYPIWLRVGKRQDGRLACLELRIDGGGGEVGPKGLRDIRLGSVLDTLAYMLNARAAIAKAERDYPTGGGPGDWRPVDRVPNFLAPRVEFSSWGDVEAVLDGVEARPRRTILPADVL